jgi:hypothetical protein
MNAIEVIYDTLISFIQKNGWYLVVLVIIWYNAQDYIKEMREKWSLADANAPERVRVLNEHKENVRRKQQHEMNDKAD